VQAKHGKSGTKIVSQTAANFDKNSHIYPSGVFSQDRPLNYPSFLNPIIDERFSKKKTASNNN